MRNRANAIRLLLLFAVITSAGEHLQAQKRDRLITTIRSGMRESMRQPDGSLTLTNLRVVEVIGFSLAGVPVTPGQPFQADDDWLTKLRVKVKNISGAPISHLRMSFALPEAQFVEGGRRVSMGLSLEYKAGARANNESPEMKVIAPGDEVELVYFVFPSLPLNQEIANTTGVNSITLLQYSGDVTAFFVDGRTWRGGNLPVGKG